MTLPAIKTDLLTKVFTGAPAVDKLSFSVKMGEIFGLVGPDGAGKTTTMRLLAGIMDPTSGSAEILGLPLQDKAEEIKNYIGYMSQRFGLYPDLTVEENIDFYADIYNVSGKERLEKKDLLLNFSGLKPFVNRLANNLSGGMKQKLGLSCALIHSPRLVLLDEPTNGVDPVSRRDFWKILKDLQKNGMSILLTTSYLDEAEKCDRIGLMNEGKLLLIGTLAELRKKLPGVFIEITLENARKEIIHLQQEYGKENVRLFGNKVHLYIQDRSNLPAMQENMRIIPPSLEDIFIAEVSN